MLSLSGKTRAYAWHRAHTPRRKPSRTFPAWRQVRGLFTLQSDEGLLEILKEGLRARRREIVALGCHSLRSAIVRILPLGPELRDKPLHVISSPPIVSELPAPR